MTFAPVGYTPLSKLWTKFSENRTNEIYQLVCEYYQSKEFIGDHLFGTPEEYGSPFDFMENIFVDTLKPITAFLSSPDSKIVSVDLQVADRTSDWFQKISVFETTIFVETHQDAVDDFDWLIAMGGHRFAPWPEKLGDPKLWSAAYPKPVDEAATAKAVRRCRYHTLPMFLERHRFVVPQTQPPWCSDPKDEAFARFMVPHFAGWAMSIRDEDAASWMNRLQKIKFDLSTFQSWSQQEQKRGRPRKAEDAVACFDQLYPDGVRGTWKQVVKDIEIKFGLTVSDKTLRRALKDREDQSKNLGQK